MNPISAFFVRNIVWVFFLYGLAFFVMGVALALASRRVSEFKFVQAIRPLAAFGIAHGIHEWIEMFQKIATLTHGYTPTVSQEIVRLAILVASFLLLSAFGISLLGSGQIEWRRVFRGVAGMASLWLLSVLVVRVALNASSDETLAMADVLARYCLGIPGALLGAWALMTQQRTFREHGMPRFGRDLVWCTTALIMYGVVGQAFVRQTALMPSNTLNSASFLQWFGIPVQLFRGSMAAILAIFMLRALSAFEFESQRRLNEANQAKLQAQAAALAAQRRVSREMARLNEELQLTTQELSLLLGLSNLLASPMSLPTRLLSVLQEIVRSLNFPEAGMILLIRRQTGIPTVRAATLADADDQQYAWAEELGQQCVETSMAMCRHTDDTIIEFLPAEALQSIECQQIDSPVAMISLPLTLRGQVIGSIVLCRQNARQETNPSTDEFRLIVGIAQQLGLSIENARLYQEAQEREKLLGELLHRVVGAQEAERRRIARELHDATGQSLTAIALGMRGTESIIDSNPSVAKHQVHELVSITTDALGELRHLISDLRPSQLDDLGLVATLQWYIQEFNRRYPIQTDLVFKGERARFPPEYEIVLFRITQEALTNVAKHSGASHATVKLEIDTSQILLTVCDDGRGFDLEEVLRGEGSRIGWGLLGIQERTALIGGEYQMESQPGQGTTIQIRVPLIVEAKDVKDTLVIG
jgi:signal transduction histidine kinase